jgi:hypothetical protein
MSEQTRKNINQFLRWNFYRTEGYINRLDAVIFREIIAAQTDKAIHGALAEIGVHYGRSFFLLAKGRSSNEKSLAMDLFEDDELHTNKQGIGRFGGFRTNCQKYGFTFSPDEIWKGSSLEASPAEIIRRVGQVRFFSIDGGHMYQHVTSDLALVEQVLASAGVISLDDVFNPLWPEVSIASFDWLRNVNGRFVPFLATQGKLYVCRPEYSPLYQEIITSNKWLASAISRKISVLSHPVLVLSPSIASRVAQRLLEKAFAITNRFHLRHPKAKAPLATSPH